MKNNAGQSSDYKQLNNIVFKNKVLFDEVKDSIKNNSYLGDKKDLLSRVDKGQDELEGVCKKVIQTYPNLLDGSDADAINALNGSVKKAEGVLKKLAHCKAAKNENYKFLEWHVTVAQKMIAAHNALAINQRAYYKMETINIDKSRERLENRKFANC
ncbi:hypothetical protein BK816_00475 [Boudabousia tangfeifanii]|uniref:Uncharacterized protein n=2 Tax=Boudabousia tangfeifanii TaxID=1912795 RepID=A0A1D9MI26_9ACTO|nr:hypothetical protein BK816_00475 [Boudabousia tangfeifanii]